MDRHNYPSTSYTYPAPSSSSMPCPMAYSLGPQYRDSEYSTPSTSMRGGAALTQQPSSVSSYSPYPASFPSEPDAQYACNLLNEMVGMDLDSPEWPPALGYQGPGPESANVGVLGLSGSSKFRDYPRNPPYSAYSAASSYPYPVLGSASFSQPAFGSGR